MNNYKNNKGIITRVLFLLALLISTLVGTTNLYADNIENCKPGEIIVKYKDGVKKPQHSAFFANGKELEIESIDENHSYYYVSDRNMNDLLRTCNKNPEIEYAQPNYKYSIEDLSSDPYINYEWGLEKINAHKVWEMNKNDKAPTIAIVDTGVTVDHLELKDNIIT